MSHSDEPTSSLSRHDDTDTGFDARFEDRWCKFERLSWCAYGALIIIGLLGLLGRGPLNDRVKHEPDGTVIHYERIVRFRTPDAIQLQVPVQHGFAQVLLDKGALTNLGLVRVLPQPTIDLGSSGTGPLVFRASPADAAFVNILLQFEPPSVGSKALRVSVDGGPYVTLNLFAVP